MPPMTAKQKISMLEHIANILLPSDTFENNYLNIKTGAFVDPVWGPWIVKGFAKSYVKGTVPAMELTLDCGYETLVHLKIIAQNPHKRNASGMLSKYAAMARKGSKICWVINDATNEFIGRVQDGTWVQSDTQAPKSKPITVPSINPHEIVSHVESAMNATGEPEGIDDGTYY